jgi:crossover junction endodeoxyribonuclease RuvC
MTWVYKSPYFGIERLVDIKSWLSDTLDYLEVEGSEILDVAIEGSVLQSPSALKLGELAAIVKLELFERERIFPLQVSPMTLKKFAAGKGNAKKQEMLLQMYKRWGVEFNDDNAADSYALARLVSGTGINKVEQDIIKQMADPKYRDEPRLA